MAHFLRKWVCPNGHHNWSYEFKCSCGLPRTKEVRWYIPDPEVEATPEQWKIMGKGPNFYCVWCAGENPEYAKDNCIACGGPIGNPETLHKGQTFDLEDQPRSGEDAVVANTHLVDHKDAGWGMGPDEEEAPVRTTRTSSAKPKTTLRSVHLPRQQNYVATTANSKVKSFFETEIANTGITYKVATIGIVILTVVALIIYAIWFNFYDTTTKSAWVTSLGWTNNTKVEQYTELDKTDWDENVPADSYNLSCSVVVREYNKKIVDGHKTVQVPGTCQVDYQTTCRVDDGNQGYTTVPCTKQRSESCLVDKQEEIYHYEDIKDNECTYNVMRWQTIGNFPNSGVISVIPPSGNSHETYFDHGGYVETPNLIHLTEELGTYTVNFSSEYVDPFSFNYDYGEWLQFDLRENVSIEVNRKGKVPFRPKITIPQ